MSGKKTAVFGIYKNRLQAEQSVDRLLSAGFANDDISVLLPDSESSKEFAHKKDTKAPEGTTAGVTTGGVVGGTLGSPCWNRRASDSWSRARLSRRVLSWAPLLGSGLAVPSVG